MHAHLIEALTAISIMTVFIGVVFYVEHLDEKRSTRYDPPRLVHKTVQEHHDLTAPQDKTAASILGSIFADLFIGAAKVVLDIPTEQKKEVVNG